MKCPRCGGNMSSGVCERCGFPETVFKWNVEYSSAQETSDEK